MKGRRSPFVEVAQHVGRSRKAGRCQFIAVPRKLVDEDVQPRDLAQAQNTEDARAQVVELGGQRRALPVPLVQPSAKVSPLADMVGPILSRVAGAERRNEIASGVESPAIVRLPGPGARWLHGVSRCKRRPGLEILGRCLPRTQVERRELDPRLGPLLKLRRAQLLFQRTQARFEMLGERAGKALPGARGVVPLVRRRCS
jgi:hypothetical protein